MTFTFWFTLTIGALVATVLILAALWAIAIETRRVVMGARRGRPLGKTAEARRVLDRAADLKFPTHRKEQS